MAEWATRVGDVDAVDRNEDAAAVHQITTKQKANKPAVAYTNHIDRLIPASATSRNYRAFS